MSSSKRDDNHAASKNDDPARAVRSTGGAERAERGAASSKEGGSTSGVRRSEIAASSKTSAETRRPAPLVLDVDGSEASALDPDALSSAPSPLGSGQVKRVRALSQGGRSDVCYGSPLGSPRGTLSVSPVPDSVDVRRFSWCCVGAAFTFSARAATTPPFNGRPNERRERMCASQFILLCCFR